MSSGGPGVPGFVYALPAIFPVFFVAIWLLVGLLLGVISGWFPLQRRFPDTAEPPLLILRWQSARMRGVRINNAMTLTACPSGLRLTMSRLFAPFQRPLFVPWIEIAAEPVTMFFVPMVRLRLGRPEAGTIDVLAQSWLRLVDAAPGAPRGDIVPGTPARRRSFLLQWATMTLLGGAFFTIAPRLAGAHPAPSILLAFAFPAIAFGLMLGFVTLIRS